VAQRGGTPRPLAHCAPRSRDKPGDASWVGTGVPEATEANNEATLTSPRAVGRSGRTGLSTPDSRVAPVLAAAAFGLTDVGKYDNMAM